MSGLWCLAGMIKRSLSVKIFELNCWAIPLAVVGGGGNLAEPCGTAAGPSSTLAG